MCLCIVKIPQWGADIHKMLYEGLVHYTFEKAGGRAIFLSRNFPLTPGCARFSPDLFPIFLAGQNFFFSGIFLDMNFFGINCPHTHQKLNGPSLNESAFSM